MISIAIAVAFRNVRAAAFIDSPRTVANTTSVIGADAFIDVIASAIPVYISCTRASTYPKGVKLVPFTVAVAFRDV